MRLSIDPTDSGFKTYQDLRLQGVTIRIFLDGQPQTDVVTVDSEEGWLVRYMKVGPTQYVVRGDSLETETVQGKVLIETGASALLN